MRELTIDQARSIAEVKGLIPARYGARVCFARDSSTGAISLSWSEFEYVLRSRSLGIFEEGRGYMIFRQVKDQCPKCLRGSTRVLPATPRYKFTIYEHGDTRCVITDGTEHVAYTDR